MAEALVGGAFLSATLQVLFDRLASPEFVNLLWGQKTVDGLLEKLKLKLLVLRAVLNDAEEKQIKNPAVKDWLDELNDAVYEADDLLDKIAYEALRRKVEIESQSSKNQVGNFISTSIRRFSIRSFCGRFSASSFESRLKEIIDRLEDFVKGKDVLGLREGAVHISTPRLPSTSLVDESGVYGRDNDKDEILKQLLSDEASGNEIGVVPIVGMGGVGKTTLAQLVYNDDRVDDHFEMKAWACVSDKFDVSGITKSIIEAITKSTCSSMDLDRLQVSLKEKLKGKKFLIVLDDIWNEDYDLWDNLKRPFIGGACGSKIIATTRNQSVAAIMQTVPVYNLQQLSDADCWSLFAKIAFNRGGSSAYPILEEIGKKIVKRCKGLPLAAKAMGGLLRSKLDVEEWNNILVSDIWDLPDNILPALRLSYRYLPSHVKQCFAFCSVYPKDYIFERESLVLLWIAQNFVQPKGNKTIEKVGDEYFNELVSNSFFQQASGYESSFIMHDLVHDLAQVVSGKFSFRSEDEKLDEISKEVRHISHLRSRAFGAEELKAINGIKSLRTFLSLNHRSCEFLSFESMDDILPTLCPLRVLSLPYCRIEKLSHWIGNLIHLRYLDLSGSHIRRLPKSVCSLYNLQTLLLSNCPLTTLPKHIGKLTYLHHLDITGTSVREMPMQISQLKDLQHLSDFVVGKHSGLGVNGLKELDHLQGRLSISKLQNVRSSKDALEANLKKKELLQELELEWDSETDDSQNGREVLQNLQREVLQNLQPHTNMKELTVKHYGGTNFPEWLGDRSFSNIVSLSLRKCKYCSSLPALGQLPSLKDLTIERMNRITKVGSEFYGNVSLFKPFQSLERLRFEGMDEWEEWTILGGEVFS